MRQVWKVVVAGLALLIAPEGIVLAQESAHLTLRQVERVFAPGEKHPPLTKDLGPAADGTIVVAQSEDGFVYELQPPIASGFQVEDADPFSPDQGTDWQVLLELGDPAGVRLTNLTSQLACLRDRGDEVRSQLAIVYDGKVVSTAAMAPQVECGTGITDGLVSVSVGSQKEAEELAGAFGWNGAAQEPSPEEPIEEREGPDTEGGLPVVPILLGVGVIVGTGWFVVRRTKS